MVVSKGLLPSPVNEEHRDGRIAPYLLRDSAAMTVGGLAGGALGAILPHFVRRLGDTSD